MKSKFLLTLIALFAITALFGTTYSAWTLTNTPEVAKTVQVEVPAWTFTEDSDFAKISNLRSYTNVNVTKEETITQGSNEAIRMTSTTGTQTKDHTIHINFDRDYTISEIQFYKFEFDYHLQKINHLNLDCQLHNFLLVLQKQE